MQYISLYPSPLGEILLACDQIGLTGLWFEGQKYFALGLSEHITEGNMPALILAKQWLDLYFTGAVPDFTPPLHLIGSEFRIGIWNLLLKIPYGSTTTYGTLAKAYALQREVRSVSAQAVGGAVGHNPISVIVPCHRVIGSSGSLTGYAGGIERKTALLLAEGIAI